MSEEWENQPRSTPEGTTKLDLVLWRLSRIERSLENNVLTRDEYLIKHNHLTDRVSDLETDAERAELDKKKLGTAVVIALIIPVGTWAIELLRITGG